MYSHDRFEFCVKLQRDSDTLFFNDLSTIHLDILETTRNSPAGALITRKTQLTAEPTKTNRIDSDKSPTAKSTHE